MKYACTLVLVPHNGGQKALAISPGDNVWFVAAEDAPPEMVEIQRTIESDGQRIVLGHLTVADDYKPE